MGMKEKVELQLQEHVAILKLNDGENRFNPPFIAAFLEALDTVEKTTDARTLVVTATDPKIFCNGIDLEWLQPVMIRGDLDTAKDYFYSVNRLFSRLLTYPLITIAAISGHAFAGGAILACAFDFRYMRSDRGYFCLPEVDLGIPFFYGMFGMLKKVIPLPVFEDMQLTARRLTADDCVRHGIVRKACHIDTLMKDALDFATELKKGRAIVGELKLRHNKDILNEIETADPKIIESGKYHVGQLTPA